MVITLNLFYDVSESRCVESVELIDIERILVVHYVNCTLTFSLLDKRAMLGHLN